MKIPKPILAAILLLVCVLAFAGKHHYKLDIKVYEIDPPNGFMSDHIMETKLPDGTRCIIYYNGGISCDFNQPRDK